MSNSHIPVNHPLRPLYRALAALVAVYLLLFAVIGLAVSGGHDTFARTGLPHALGLPVNRGFALLCLLLGLLLLAATAIGRNIDRAVYLGTGVGLMVVAMVMLAVARTSANVLGASVATVVVWCVLGLVLFAAGMYAKSDPAVSPAAEYQQA